LAVSAIELCAPEIAYGRGAPVLSQVRLRVERGEVVAVLGGNGAGKTALLRWIAGLLPRRAGRCLIGGVEIRSARQAVAQSVGLLVQDPNDQLLGATVREDVELGPRNLGLLAAECEDRVDRALSAVGISALAEREIESLSLGERKRTSLAGVLAMAPRVLLLDEPTAGLDPHGESALCETLRGLAATGITQIVATHAIDLVPHFATRALVLADGRVLADGPCRDVLQKTDLLERARLRRPWPVELWARALKDRVSTVTVTMEEVLPCLTTASC
jgi:cobalt/nickel transport system ATP-binding protein